MAAKEVEPIPGSRVVDTCTHTPYPRTLKCTYIDTCMRTHTHIHIYFHIHMHTHMHVVVVLVVFYRVCVHIMYAISADHEYSGGSSLAARLLF